VEGTVYDTPEAKLAFIESERRKWAADTARSGRLGIWYRVRATPGGFLPSTQRLRGCIQLIEQRCGNSKLSRHFNLYRTNEFLDGQKWFK
jgi:hypothetical protein